MGTWHWPQITLTVLMAMRLLIMSRYHGRPKVDKYNFWNEGLANIALTVTILYYGGFFLGNHP